MPILGVGPCRRLRFDAVHRTRLQQWRSPGWPMLINNSPGRKYSIPDDKSSNTRDDPTTASNLPGPKCSDHAAEAISASETPLTNGHPSNGHVEELARPKVALETTPEEVQAIMEEGGLPQVPWGAGKIMQVMVLWLLAYILIGQVAVPILLMLLGIDRDDMSVRGHAILHLCLDVSQLGVTLMILWHCLRDFRPRQLGLFPVRWRGAWPLLVLLGCLVFPVVDWVAQQSMGWFQTDADLWTNHVEHSLSLGDWITNVAYFCVVSICAPIWEEAIFRGFLLASLARFMPVGVAVVVSSLIFAMCHFRLQTFLPLLMLGIVFSCTFLATRNLLPPIALHSAWNIYVLCNLLFRPA